MRPIAVCLLAWLVLGAPAGARPVPQSVGQQPVFRAGVDVIQLDVTVLDKTRKPIHGLTAANFTVTENGTPQTLVGASEVVVPSPEDLPAAWLRLIPADVETNFLGDRLGDGRIVVVVMDDAGVAFNDEATIESARAVGRSIVARLGPTDLASVVYTRDAGLSQDFTTDRDKLLKAIEAFEPHPAGSTFQTPAVGYANEGDMQRHDEATRWTRCEQAHPSVPTLEAVARMLAGLTRRRKTIIDITSGRGARPAEDRSCPSEIDADTRDLFSLAQRANVNIYPIDPAGLMPVPEQPSGFRPSRGGPRSAESAASGGAPTENLKTLAVNTGGTAVVETNDFDGGLDRIFEENGSYYLLGYQSTDQDRDGKFRRVDVHVSTPGAVVLARRGYYGATTTKAATETAPGDAATRTDRQRVGLSTAPGLTLRVALAPFALPAPAAGPRRAAVLVTLGIREPAPAASVTDVVTVITSVTRDGTAVGAFEPHAVTIPLQSTTGETVPYEWTTQLDLAPGRYEVRLNAHSKLSDAGASVYGDVDVPDFSKPGVSLSGLVFGTATDSAAQPEAPRVGLVPVAVTSERSFARGEHITALIRVYQGGAAPLAAVLLKTQVLDAKNASSFSDNGTLNPDEFDATRSADYRLDLSTLNLKPGPLLLDIQALMADGSTAQRDVPFVIR